MHRVYNNSKCLPKPLVTSCQIKAIRGPDVKKIEFKLPCSGGEMHISGQVLVKNAKMAI